MLRLASSWVWDFWTADDGEKFHLFFLKASRALGDPDRRHWRASIGHAVSDDLKNWTELADAIVASDRGGFDDVATWTGSVIRTGQSTWRMFYTGVDAAGSGVVQRIGWADSADLQHWAKADTAFGPDLTWYEDLSLGTWPDEAWRDPWVEPNPAGDGWRMLVTARARTGEPHERGIVGAATSTDLTHWTAVEPLSEPGAGFGQLEVLQLVEIGGRHVLVFSCLDTELSVERRRAGERGGVFAVNVDDPAGPFDIGSAYLLADQALYAGRLVRDRAGQWGLMAFRHTAPTGEFIGEIIDPIPVGWAESGQLQLSSVSVES